MVEESCFLHGPHLVRRVATSLVGKTPHSLVSSASLVIWGHVARAGQGGVWRYIRGTGFWDRIVGWVRSGRVFEPGRAN